MGTFMGHVGPGTIMFLLGFRWTYASLYRFFLCMRESKLLGSSKARKFQSSFTFPTAFAPGIPVEGFFILILGIVISIAEFVTAFQYGFLQNGQHLTMYSFFLVTGLVVVLKHYKVCLIPAIDYACFILTLLMNQFLVASHVMHKTSLERQIHMVSVYVFAFITIMLVLEIKHRNHVLLPLCRSTALSLSGSWLWTQAVMMYPKIGEPWPKENHAYILVANMSLAWNVLLQLIIAGILSMYMVRKVQKMSPDAVSAALDLQGLPRVGGVASQNKSIRFGAEHGGSGMKPLLNCDDDDVCIA